jgi:hypothetical protein
MKKVRHETFFGPIMYWTGSLNSNRERYRKQAEDFINEIGVENVLSVTEHAIGVLSPFTVVVWYMVDEDNA